MFQTTNQSIRTCLKPAPWFPAVDSNGIPRDPSRFSRNNHRFIACCNQWELKHGHGIIGLWDNAKTHVETAPKSYLTTKQLMFNQ